MRIFLKICLIAWPTLAYAQEGKWVVVTAQYIGSDVIPQEGKRRALEIARGEAIKQVVGVKTTEETYWNQAEVMRGGVSEDSVDVFSRLSRSTASGKIINEEKEERTLVENDQPVYVVTLHACVVPDESEPDPTFQVTLNTDRDVYYDRSPRQSDEVKISINSTRDCYLYLFNILSNDSVQLLMPSDYLPINEFRVDAKTQAFEEAIKIKSVHFHVGVPQGKLRTKEAFYLVGTKRKIDFHSENLSRDGRNVIPTKVVALMEIMNWLVRIPADMEQRFLGVTKSERPIDVVADFDEAATNRLLSFRNIEARHLRERQRRKRFCRLVVVRF